MWWKIILGFVALTLVTFIGIVVKIAIDDVKEETKDILKANRDGKSFS